MTTCSRNKIKKDPAYKISGVVLKRMVFTPGGAQGRHDLEGVVQYLGSQIKGKFSLRYVTHGNGQVLVYILFRDEIPKGQWKNTRTGTEVILSGLTSYLKAHFEDYEFESIPENEIVRALKPFKIGAMVEMSRTMAHITVISGDGKKPRQAIGFHQVNTDVIAGKTNNSTRLFYVVPFIKRVSYLRRWYDMLTRQTRSCMLDIAVTPLSNTVSAEALGCYDDLVRKCEDVLHGEEEANREKSFGLGTAQTLRNWLCQQKALLEMPGNLYAMHIRVAFDGKAGPELVQAAGEAITGPAENLPNLSSFVAGGFAATNINARQFASIVYELEPEKSDNSPQHLFDGISVSRVMALPIADDLSFPGIEVKRVRFQPAPMNLPASGILIGEANTASDRVSVRLKIDDLRRHVQIYGQTGVGKSTAIIMQVQEAMRSGHGMAVIDPHGDLTNDILKLIPRNRWDDVILFDVSDTNHPVGLNLFQFETDSDKVFITSEMDAIMDMLFLKEHRGPQFSQFLRNLTKVLMADKNDPGTLAQIPRLIEDHDFRRRKLKRAKDEQLRFFWEVTWPDCLNSRDSSYLAYFTSKFEQFVYDPIMRNIIGQKKCTINFDKVISQQSILLANMSKGILSEQNSNLLSMIFSARLWNAAIKRIRLPLNERKDFYIFVDEWQNLATDTFVTGLSEARKFGVSFVLANQYISQLPEKVLHSVMGNVGTIMSFRVGIEDSRKLAEYYAPSVGPLALSGQPNYHCYTRMMMDGVVTQPFSMWTRLPALPLENIQREAREYIVGNSRKLYASPIKEVERELYRETRTEGRREERF